MQKAIKTSDKNDQAWLFSSMTGFGRHQQTQGDYEIICEVRSLNHRNLELKMSLPSEFLEYESELSQVIKECVQRGRLEIAFAAQINGLNFEPVRFQAQAAQKLLSEIMTLSQKEPYLKPEIRAGDLFHCRELFSLNEKKSIPSDIEAHLKDILRKALSKVLVSRNREGAYLKNVCARIWTDALEMIQNIEKLAKPDRLERLDSLKDKIKGLCDGALLEKDRLMLEIALIIERADITEELDRLKAHFLHFHTICSVLGAKGRRLDFLCQEMLREVNTLMSKAFGVFIGPIAIELKSEIERLREQVQNIE